MGRENIILPENPSPRQTVLEDGTVMTRTCAWSPPGCHGTGCGLRLYVKDGELIKVEGDPENQQTRGRLCPRCLALKEYVYHPDRIIYPMKRDKKDRGLDKWKRISWDEATEIIVRETRRIQETWGPESVVLYGGTGRAAVMYGFEFCGKVLKSPNYCYSQSGWSCMGPRVSSVQMMTGIQYLELDFGGCYPDMWDNPAYIAPEYVLLVGKEPLKSNPDGLWGHSLLELMKKKGTKLISVDPRVTWIGTRGAYHLAIKPNTDAALILAFLNVIINEDLYDHEWVEKWAYGFDELKERVQEYPPSFAAKECDVDESLIFEVARVLGKSRWSLLMGVATDQNPNGPQVVQALISLVGITGNLDRPGGTQMQAMKLYDNKMAEYVDVEIESKTIGWKDYPVLSVFLNTTHPDITLEALETDKPYPLKMAWIDSTNLLAPTNSAQPKRWHDALRKMEFVAAKEAFMTPAVMALADVVLPLATFAEHDGIVVNNVGRGMGIYGAYTKALEVGECKSDLEMLVHFGKAFHGDEFEFQSVEDFLEGKMNRFGMTWDELKTNVSVINTAGGYRKYETGKIRGDGQLGFQTPTGRLELYSTGYFNFNEDPLPYYIKPVLAPDQNPQYADAYPLTISTGPRQYASFHSEHRQIPSLRALNPDPLAEVHPETAKKYGIRDGDKIFVENPWGSCEYRASVRPTVRKDQVSVDHGWWFPEEDGEEPNLFGVWKCNANQLLPHKIIGKMGFGAPYKCLPGTIRKAEND